MTDLLDLSGLSVGGLLDLVRALLCETNGEKAEEVSIGGSDVDVRLDQGLPLAYERAELVRGEVHAVEGGQAVLALDLVDAQLDLLESLLVVLVEIGKRELQDTSLQGIGGVFCAPEAVSGSMLLR